MKQYKEDRNFKGSVKSYIVSKSSATSRTKPEVLIELFQPQTPKNPSFPHNVEEKTPHIIGGMERVTTDCVWYTVNFIRPE